MMIILNDIHNVSKKEFVAQEANFQKQNYKFQYTVCTLLKAFGCCRILVHSELGPHGGSVEYISLFTSTSGNNC